MAQQELERIDLDEFKDEDFYEMYVCALLLMSESSSIVDAHGSVLVLRDRLEFEDEGYIPTSREIH